MLKKLLIFICILSFCSFSHGKSIEPLKAQINTILETKDATVGVAILAGDSSESLSINGDKHLPMQSVFKYHLALAVLDQVDKGDLSLSQEIKITAKDVDIELWSPIRKKYPNGTSLTLTEVMKSLIAYSDNVSCDVLIRILGGPKALEKHLHSRGITDIAVKYILWDTLKGSKTGKDMIKGNLPEGTVVAHKTGSSGKNKAGLSAARNNIGIVFLPDGRYFYLSVFVSDSIESRTENKKIIADIAKLTWDYFDSE